MPDPYLTDLPARTVTPEHIRRARLRVATASLAEYPDEGDPRAGWDLMRLLDALGLLDSDGQ